MLLAALCKRTCSVVKFAVPVQILYTDNGLRAYRGAMSGCDSPIPCREFATELHGGFNRSSNGVHAKSV